MKYMLNNLLAFAVNIEILALSEMQPLFAERYDCITNNEILV